MKSISVVFTIFTLLWPSTLVEAEQSASVSPLGEKTIVCFHCKDFETALGPTESGQDIGHHPDGWSNAMLFDGDADSSLLFRYCDPPHNVASVERTLLIVDQPKIDQKDFAIAGRWAFSGASTSDTFGPGPWKVALHLTAEYAHADSQSAAVNYSDADSPPGTFHSFRLPLKLAGGVIPKRLTFSISIPTNFDFVIEDVRLVEPSPTPPAPPLPPAGVEPDGTTPSETHSFTLDTPSTLSSLCPVQSYGPNAIELIRRPDDGSPRQVSIASIDAPPVSADDFGFVANIAYGGREQSKNFDGSAYFAMTTFFPDGTHRIVGTTAPFGPSSLISQQSDQRPMRLSMHSVVRPTRLELKLIADGTGEVTITDLSLADFAPPPLSTAPTAEATPPSAMRPPVNWLPGSVVLRGISWATAIAALMLTITIIRSPSDTLARIGLTFLLILGQLLFATAMFLLGRSESFATVAPLFAGVIAWLVPLLAQRLVSRRIHQQELRKMLTIDAV